MIRFAEKKDGMAAAELILIILKDMELDFLNYFSEEETKKVIADCFLDPTYRYSYRRGIVDEIDGEIAGVAFGYPAEDEAVIDLPLMNYLKEKGIEEDIKMFIDPETVPGEWYLDSIAVNPEFRGHGIGSRLIESLDKLALRDGKEVIGLNVDQGNPQAKRLYARQGFHDVGEMTLSGHVYDHMQKKVAQPST